MKINPISFKGTFYIDKKDLDRKKMRKILAKQQEFSFTFEHSSLRYTDDIFVHMPNNCDSKFSKFLSKLEVNHERMSEAKILNTNNIISRIVLSEDAKCSGCTLNTINVKKLDAELQKNKDHYVGVSGTNGSPERYERFKKFLMTDQKIEAPLVYLMRLKNGEISTHIYDGRHRFAVLRDMGISEIPVALDEESLILAKEIDII